jgi:hypothetical protein
MSQIELKEKSIEAISQRTLILFNYLKYYYQKINISNDILYQELLRIMDAEDIYENSKNQNNSNDIITGWNCIKNINTTIKLFDEDISNELKSYIYKIMEELKNKKETDNIRTYISKIWMFPYFNSTYFDLKIENKNELIDFINQKLNEYKILIYEIKNNKLIIETNDNILKKLILDIWSKYNLENSMSNINIKMKKYTIGKVYIIDLSNEEIKEFENINFENIKIKIEDIKHTITLNDSIASVHIDIIIKNNIFEKSKLPEIRIPIAGTPRYY